jgi:hypothetical protein
MFLKHSYLLINMLKQPRCCLITSDRSSGCSVNLDEAPVLVSPELSGLSLTAQNTQIHGYLKNLLIIIMLSSSTADIT